jgi:hypothetical protein
MGLKILLVLAVLSLTSPGFCQDNGDFFEKNYAANPLDQKSASSVDSQSDVKPPDQTVKKEPKLVQEEKSFNEVDTSVETLRTDAGQRINWIGLIVSIKNESLLDKSFSTLQKITRRHDLSIGPIYLLGIPTELSKHSALLSEVAIRGGSLNLQENPPKEFPVTKSPSWIISVEKGEILLDGIIDPTLFFNDQGHYIGDPSAEIKQ